MRFSNVFAHFLFTEFDPMYAIGMRTPYVRAFFLLCALLTTGVSRGQSLAITGTVTVADSAEPLPGVHVFLDRTPTGTITDARGRYVLRGMPAGEHTLVARFVGFETVRRTVQAGANDIHIVLTPTTEVLEEVVVTAIGERQALSDVAATVQSIRHDDIVRLNAAHPSEVMGRIPGVWINNTSGEGHMTAIRQPLTTDPVYLYLENGVPTRSTGFFNHNALYELNMPMAEAIEVMKGPGSALYGSDAVGGVINVSTRPVPDAPAAGVSLESGSFGFGRVMLGTGTQIDRHGLRLDVMAVKGDGWRDASRYDRQAGTLTWDARLGGTATLKTVASFSIIDQEPAGASTLSEADYSAAPRRNYTPISYRDVSAFRISSAFERLTPNGAVTLTPYARINRMEILPNWSLSYDPTVYTTEHSSIGLLARYRHDLGVVRLVTGMDAELSPGDHVEYAIDPEQVDGIYTAYEKGALLYDYGASFQQAAPYVHAEIAPFERLRLTAGLRADLLAFEYDNHLSAVTDGPHRRAADDRLTYRHLSPKLGATYRFYGASSVFASYRHAFRVPSEGQLFRQGSTTNTLDLEPVKADNLEVGLRLYPLAGVSLELSAYDLGKRDDIVTYVDEAGVRISINAGETSHRGVEAGLEVRPFDALRLTGSYSYAVHTFEDWQPSASTDLSGNEMDAAPRSIGFVEASYQMGERISLSIDANLLGSYWMDPENTVKYDGHSVVGLRGSVELPAGVTLFGRVTNLTDQRYAERASYNAFRGEEFAPAQPRAIYFGVRFGVGGDE